MADLFSYLGLAWPRLLLYPGGVFALALLWLLRKVRSGPPSNASAELQVAACVPPLLLLCLLPLPGAATLPRPIDLPTALALLEWPVALAFVAGAATRADPRALAARYAPLLLAACAIVLGSRSLALDALVRPPPPGPLPRALLAAGAACWALALPALLGPGPDAAPPSQRWGDQLRVLGHGLLAALPWLALLPSPWLAPLPVMLVFLLLFFTDRSGPQGRAAWIVAGRAAAALVGALILLSAIVALQERLV